MEKPCNGALTIAGPLFGNRLLPIPSVGRDIATEQSCENGRKHWSLLTFGKKRPAMVLHHRSASFQQLLRSIPIRRSRVRHRTELRKGSQAFVSPYACRPTACGALDLTWAVPTAAAAEPSQIALHRHFWNRFWNQSGLVAPGSRRNE